MANDYDVDVEIQTEEVDVDIHGIRGARGYSAYEVAVQNGFVGTKAEWLASLKGETGEKGDTGETGPVGRGIKTAYVAGDYTLHLRFTDDKEFVSQSIRGARGNSIWKVEYNETTDGLHITMEDGTEYDTPSLRGIQGLKGDTGNGIASAVLNADNTLTLTWTDGNFYTTPSIKGEKGDTYTLTAEDKAEIYDKVLSDYPSVEEVSF